MRRCRNSFAFGGLNAVVALKRCGRLGREDLLRRSSRCRRGPSSGEGAACKAG
jgi:hypothetical protein